MVTKEKWANFVKYSNEIYNMTDFQKSEAMPKKKITFLLIIMIASLASSCRNSEYFDLLLQAESVIDEMPDSALTILEAIHPETLKTDKERALYGLLQTEARIKKHIEEESDTLIAQSADYFLSNGDMAHAIPAVYYYGRTTYLLGDSPKAISLYFQAKDMAEEQEEWFWAGMACRGIADIYSDHYNAAEELEYAKKEYEYTLRSGRQPYINYALNDLGTAYANNGMTNTSIDISYQLSDSANKFDDKYLLFCSDQLKGYACFRNNQFNQATISFEKACQTGYAETKDSFLLSYCLLEIGEQKLSENLLKQVSDKNSIWKYKIRSRIYEKQGNVAKAFTDLDSLGMLSESVIRESISHNLTTNITDFYRLSKQLADAKNKNKQARYVVVILTLGLLFVLLYLSFVIINHRQKRVIASKVAFANQLQFSLDELKTLNIENSKIIDFLNANQYKLLDELTAIVLKSKDVSKTRRMIADKVTTLLDELT
ncbi:MAG: hypothetical protein K2M80_01780, partial [Muribaculaceae bacterium]|nr:hypothetical protein [Muribaculaceae bacterium]